MLMSVVITVMACNSVIAQTVDNIINQRKLFENNPQIMVGGNPLHVAMNPFTNKVYVANMESGTVSVIDSNSGSRKDIRVGDGPSYIAIDIYHNKIYVTNRDSNTVSVIDGNNDTEIEQISVGKSPTHIFISNNPTPKIYVANYDGNTISVINSTNDKKELHDIPVGSHPNDIGMALTGIYVINSGGNTVSIINYTDDKTEPDILVGDHPLSLAVGPLGYKIYVAHYPGIWGGNGSISVINDINHKRAASDIPVGNGGISADDVAIVGPPRTSKIYVANYYSNTVSVIKRNDTDYKRVAPDISVGKFPHSIAIGYPVLPSLRQQAKIYVTNMGSNTVSVINSTNDKKELHDIPVGMAPTDIVFNYSTGMIYVVNGGSVSGNTGSVSVIDEKTDKVAAGITLKTRPANSGRIVCGSTEYPTNIYLYVDNGTYCTVQPNKDFQFIGWEENLNQNSTIPLDDSSGNLTVNRYGTFTANFKPLPPPIPPEYLFLIITVLVTTVIGWSWNGIVGLVKARTQRTYLKECINQIGKLDKNAIEEKITGYYVDGRISEDHRQFLRDKISEYYDNVKGSESGV
jgi:YVTN family beta-propeller protein